ncbi:enoyl reductase [Angomonas deanei]|uniref:3-oxo-5-alpha-steroid 4-dehydrogenase C-terminal domain-containing protein n=1 Tax=Angomonas deanei TaxID=59799 RepID=A0A7G2CC36_9TRYP|nr:enoyl reductase [Angomonas deanei]CAD2217370.1 3-oxo-5-alpha-steroid 4-dehydrogenase/Protein of unknown function (DUF1295), putative [Angomonas deanei]|eukprot:EPY35043.1 enoyl reductase [Angomonas deanei]
MKVTVVSGPRTEEVDLPNNATLTDLKKAYRPKVSIHRKSFKVPSADQSRAKEGKPQLTTLSDKTSLAEQGVKEGAQITYKDLGPQIGYRTVFLVEYAGPLAFILFYAMRPSFIYGASITKEYGYAQKVFISLFAAHFIKRELETVFVHKFSRPTMPLRNIFKNSIYYWSFAAFIGYILCHPDYTEPSATQVNIGAVAMVINELLNFAVHYQLSTMRKGDGDTARNVPEGPLFSLVSCPNYFFEVMSWVSFSVGTNMISSWFFTLAGLLQMAEWALKKHAGYVKVDPSNKKKKAILPFLL